MFYSGFIALTIKQLPMNWSYSGLGIPVSVPCSAEFSDEQLSDPELHRYCHIQMYCKVSHE